MTHFKHVAINIQLFSQYVGFGRLLGVTREKKLPVPYFRHSNYRAVVFLCSVWKVRQQRNLKLAYVKVHTLCCRENLTLFGNHTFLSLVHRGHSLGGAVAIGYYQVIYGKAHGYFGKRTCVIHMQVSYKQRVNVLYICTFKIRRNIIGRGCKPCVYNSRAAV